MNLRKRAENNNELAEQMQSTYKALYEAVFELLELLQKDWGKKQ